MTPAAPIRLIALDLDGTTLVRGRISRRTRRTLEKAAARGIEIVIATGRVFSSLPKSVFEVRGLSYVLTSNGAILTDLRSGEIVYRNCMDPATVLAAASLLAAYPQYPVEVFTAGHAYIDEAVYHAIEAGGYPQMSRTYVLTTREPIPAILSFLTAHRDAVENINVHVSNQQEKREMRARLLTLPHATITSSTSLNLEIGGETTSKADGLAFLCRLLGLSMEAVMACGDSPNDIAMLQEAGWGVAVASGEAEVRAAADAVTGPCREEGVAEAVARFALQKPWSGAATALIRAENRALNAAARIVRRLRR